MQFKHKITLNPVELSRDESDLFLFPGQGQSLWRGLKQIRSGKGGRRRIVPLQQAAKLFRPPPMLPTFAEPQRVRMAKRRVGVFQVLEFAFSLFPLSQITAQDGVNEARLRSEAQAPGHLHRLVHRSVIGDSVEPKHLVKPEAQKNLQHGLLGAAGCFGCDQPIECGLPANGSECEFLDQAVIGGAQWPFGQLMFEDFLDKFLLCCMPFEDRDGNFSWFLAAHSLIITVAQLQARTYS